MPDLYAVLTMTVAQDGAIFGRNPSEIATWFRTGFASLATSSARCLSFVGPMPEITRDLSWDRYTWTARWLVRAREACYLPTAPAAPTPDSVGATPAERAEAVGAAWRDIGALGTAVYTAAVAGIGRAYIAQGLYPAVTAVPFDAETHGPVSDWETGVAATRSPTQEGVSPVSDAARDAAGTLGDAARDAAAAVNPFPAIGQAVQSTVDSTVGLVIQIGAVAIGVAALVWGIQRYQESQAAATPATAPAAPGRLRRAAPRSRLRPPV